MSPNKEKFEEEMSKQFKIEDYVDFSDYRLYVDFSKKGKVLDIGFRFGHETIYFARNGFQVVAVDIEDTARVNLNNRIDELNLCNKPSIEYRIGNILEIDFNKSQFSTILANNIIHFFNKEDCYKLFKIIDELLEVDGMIFIIAHHKNHPNNHPKQKFFKQFFDKESLLSYFDEDKYKVLKYSCIENIIPIKWKEMQEMAEKKSRVRFKKSNIKYINQIMLIIQKIK